MLHPASHKGDGKEGERPFVSLILSDGETGISDRGYQSHQRFDLWLEENILFVCRIKAGTEKTILKENHVDPESIVFFDAIVLLGTPNVNQTQVPIRLVGYKIDDVQYWIATDRHDLTAE